MYIDPQKAAEAAKRKAAKDAKKGAASTSDVAAASGSIGGSIGGSCGGGNGGSGGVAGVSTADVQALLTSLQSGGATEQCGALRLVDCPRG